MNEFRDGYQTAMQNIKEYHVDALSCLDKDRHHKRVLKQVKRLSANVFAVSGLLFLCGFGMTQAADYVRGIEDASEIITYADSSAADSAQDNQPASAMAAMRSAPVAELEGAPVADIEATSGEQDIQAAKKTVIFPQPTAAILEGAAPVEITFDDRRAAARYELEGRVLLLERTENAVDEEPSAQVASEAAVNRDVAYETEKGYTYLLSEEVSAEAEELKQYASVTVGKYTLSVDFYGFTKQEVTEILESIDLSQYE